ncbi:hypothetical protein ACFE04_015148 [Oxalis oulophora]
MKRGGELELPPGFRFHPTDDELVDHYLIRKCTSQPVPVPIIAELDLYKFDPWQLPERALYGEKEWYFFSPRDRKYPNGSRPNRSAGSGYWKATGADKPIGKLKPLGIKKSLVFYAGKAPKGVKTNWIMHEYRLANVDRTRKGSIDILLFPPVNSASWVMQQVATFDVVDPICVPRRLQLVEIFSTIVSLQNLLDDWVLCRLYNKKGSAEKYFPVDREMVKLESHEDHNPDISYGHNFMVPSQQLANNSDMLHMDSSSSEQGLSPEITYEKEVQSDPKWNDMEDAFNNNIQQFNYMDGFQNGAFDSQGQFNNEEFAALQDMFMFLQKPF